MKPIIFLNSHPIQYFAPLYQKINREEPDFKLEVLYCSDASVKGQLDKGFGTKVKWDIPLLEGYRHVFLNNNSPKPSVHKGFWGIINWDIIKYLKRRQKSIIVVHGWGYATNVITIIAAKILGHTVCLRAETPLNQEKLKNRKIIYLKHLYLRFLFLFVDKFLYIGYQNKLFYQSLGVKHNALIFAPYTIDNDRFKKINDTVCKQEARDKLGLSNLNGKKIILFSAKYITKKRPLDLLKAIENIDNVFAIMVGEGELRQSMESFIDEKRIHSKVKLTGFINQTEIPLYYAAADIFVLCSGLGETWGLSTNEAMNFESTLVISDTCGSSYDLVKESENGYVFKTGDIEDLKKKIELCRDMTEEQLKHAKKTNMSILQKYDYSTVIEGLKCLQNMSIA